MSLRTRITRVVAVVGASAVVTASLLATTGSSEQAAAAPPYPETVSADALPTAQINNGVVWAMEIVGDIVYVGGEFTQARPPGAAPNTNLVTRQNFLAFNLRTGQLTSLQLNFNAAVRDIAVSPNGSQLYVVGGFTQVNGQTRNRVAVINIPSGTLSSTVVPNINGMTQSVAATANAVYVGGYFSAINGQGRARAGAFNPSNGQTLAWRPIVDDGMVQGMAANQAANKVVLSGSFTSMDAGASSATGGYGIGMVDGTTGASLPLPANTEVRNAGSNSGVTKVRSDGDNFYGVGWHYGRGGNMEGFFSAKWSNGTLNWIEDCHGDTYDVAVNSTNAYLASHKHYCANSGGFPQTDPWSFAHSTATTLTPEGVNLVDKYGYPDHDGVARPEILNWYPQTDVGTYTGKSQAAWATAATDEYVVYGGEFPRVNGQTQYGLVRYAKRSIAPNDQGPRLHRNQTSWNPAAVRVGSAIRVSYATVWDRDDVDLTYRVYRDTENAAGLIDTRTVSSPFFLPRSQTVTDTVSGSHQYRVTATDPWGNVLRSAWVGSTTSPYSVQVLADSPDHFWRMADPNGYVGMDSAGTSALRYDQQVTRGGAGGLTGDTDQSTTFTNGFGATTTPQSGPNTFTVEAWFRTNTTTGGKIIGFGNYAESNSTLYDRHVYMGNDGRLRFGVRPGGGTRQVVQSAATYNDNQWHHVVATLGSTGMRLYVDGAQVAQNTSVTTGWAFNGIWRVGKDPLSSWSGAPSSAQFEGAIDEVAVYSTALPLARVQAHHQAGKGGPVVEPPVNQPPVPSIATPTITNLAVQLTGSATDADGPAPITYSWNFGNGATATGASVSYTYPAAGTYTIRLRATDGAGAWAETTRQVTVSSAPPPDPDPDPDPEPGAVLASDAFNRTLANQWGSADVGGAWSLRGGNNRFSVANGAGVMTLPQSAALTTYADLNSVSSTSTRVDAVFSVDKVITGTYVAVQGRRVGSEFYAARIKVENGGAVRLVLLATNGAVGSSLLVPGLTIAPGQKYVLSVEVTGTGPTTVKGKVWRQADPEPAGWQLQGTNTLATLQAAGAASVFAYLPNTPSGPLAVSFDSVTVRDPQ